jgi:hypothetical protein
MQKNLPAWNTGTDQVELGHQTLLWDKVILTYVLIAPFPFADMLYIEAQEEGTMTVFPFTRQ